MAPYIEALCNHSRRNHNCSNHGHGTKILVMGPTFSAQTAALCNLILIYHVIRIWYGVGITYRYSDLYQRITLVNNCVEVGYKHTLIINTLHTGKRLLRYCLSMCLLPIY